MYSSVLPYKIRLMRGSIQTWTRPKSSIGSLSTCWLPFKEISPFLRVCALATEFRKIHEHLRRLLLPVFLISQRHNIFLSLLSFVGLCSLLLLHSKSQSVDGSANIYNCHPTSLWTIKVMLILQYFCKCQLSYPPWLNPCKVQHSQLVVWTCTRQFGCIWHSISTTEAQFYHVQSILCKLQVCNLERT